MELQLNRSGIKDTSCTKRPDLNCATKDVKNIINQNFDGNNISSIYLNIIVIGLSILIIILGMLKMIVRTKKYRYEINN